MNLSKSSVLLLLGMLTGCSGEARKTPLLYPESAAPGARLLIDNCGGCHAPPLPSTHTAQRWPSVVARMHTLRAQQGLARMSQNESTELLKYLQKHASVNQR